MARETEFAEVLMSCKGVFWRSVDGFAEIKALSPLDNSFLEWINANQALVSTKIMFL